MQYHNITARLHLNSTYYKVRNIHIKIVTNKNTNKTKLIRTTMLIKNNADIYII